MARIPMHWRPAIGFALWHLQQGDTEEVIMTQYRKDDRFADLDTRSLRRCIDLARINYDATNLMRDLLPVARREDTDEERTRCDALWEKNKHLTCGYFLAQARKLAKGD